MLSPAGLNGLLRCPVAHNRNGPGIRQETPGILVGHVAIATVAPSASPGSAKPEESLRIVKTYKTDGRRRPAKSGKISLKLMAETADNVFRKQPFKRKMATLLGREPAVDRHKVTKTRELIDCGFYDDPEVLDMLLDRCIEAITRDVNHSSAKQARAPVLSDFPPKRIGRICARLMKRKRYAVTAIIYRP